jgi:hypothetical protein
MFKGEPQFTQDKFSVPTGDKVSQKEWDRIFGKKKKKK